MLKMGSCSVTRQRETVIRYSNKGRWGVFVVGCCLVRGHRIYADLQPFLVFRLEFDGAVDEGEERVIFAPTNVVPRVNLSSALADKDVAGPHEFATEALHAKEFGF